MIEPPERTIGFVVTIDSLMVAGRLLQQRFRMVSSVIEVGFVAAGAILAAAGTDLGFIVAISGLVMLILDRTAIYARMLTRRQARSVLGTVRECTTTPAGLRYRTVTSNGEIPWSSITAIRQNDDVVLFLCDRLALYYIPASAFASKVDMASFVDGCHSRLSPAPSLV